MTFRAAFYRATRPGMQGIYSRVVRLVDRGPYSHGEIVFSDGMSGSASYIDKGVRLKRIDFDDEHWDFIKLPSHLEKDARTWFEEHAGAPYDLSGNLRFVFWMVRADDKGWFCNEAMGAALGHLEPWRLGPNGLAAMLRTMYGST